jgi:hypothetical protein
VPDSQGAAEGTRVEVAGRRLRLTSLDKLLYPSTETTKGEVLHYYAQVAPVMIPLIGRRAVTRIRWPHGVEGPMFFEKNLPSGAPSWLPRVTVSSHGRDADAHPDRDRLTYPLVLDLADLTYLVNLASLELHVHQWTVTRSGKPRNPNRLVVDLDPGEPAGLGECAQVALLVKDRLEQVRGIGKNAGIFRLMGQTNVEFRVDPRKCERWGVRAADVNNVIDTAVRGKAFTQMIEGEKLFDVTLRWVRSMTRPSSSMRDEPDSFFARATRRRWAPMRAWNSEVLNGLVT